MYTITSTHIQCPCHRRRSNPWTYKVETYHEALHEAHQWARENTADTAALVRWDGKSALELESDAGAYMNVDPA